MLPIEWLVADLLIGYDVGTRRGSETSATWVLAGLRKAGGSLIMRRCIAFLIGSSIGLSCWASNAGHSGCTPAVMVGTE